MTKSPSRLLESPGTWLLARDLRDQPRLAAARLAQHNVAAHRTWGCSGGLTVTYDNAQVNVTPGAAIDRCGRTLVLSRPFRCDLAPGSRVNVVLTAVEDGPASCVGLREPGDLRESDVPLAALSETGTLLSGDGYRAWLRRPGPARVLGGPVPRGSAATGDMTDWFVHVDLRSERLDASPAVIVSLIGRPPDVVRFNDAPPIFGIPHVFSTTVDVRNVGQLGFDIEVRTHVWIDGSPFEGLFHGHPDDVHTTPVALAWLALSTTERPDFPDQNETDLP